MMSVETPQIEIENTSCQASVFSDTRFEGIDVISILKNSLVQLCIL